MKGHCRRRMGDQGQETRRLGEIQKPATGIEVKGLRRRKGRVRAVNITGKRMNKMGTGKGERAGRYSG